MSSLAHTQTSHLFPVALRARLANGVSLLAWLVETIRFELEVRRSLREVEGFDDKMLRDIGLQRGGIEHALRHGVSKA
jgi:hypothetical protein